MLRPPDGMHEAPKASPSKSRIIVLGRAGLLRDVVAHALAAATGDVLDLSAMEVGGDDVLVAVLVDPREEHWAQAQMLQASILAVSATDRTEDVMDLILRGVDAVVTPDSSLEQLAEAVAIVAAGGSVVPPGSMRNVLRALRSTADRWRATLTPREHDILASIERGESIKQTARGLGISEKTVQNLQSRLFSKLQARNRAQAITRAHELSLF